MSFFEWAVLACLLVLVIEGAIIADGVQRSSVYLHRIGAAAQDKIEGARPMNRRERRKRGI